ncbi:MAG: PQQ-binding-like beta-propeller repeat protein [Phycisphaerae bacterium]
MMHTWKSFLITLIVVLAIGAAALAGMYYFDDPGQLSPRVDVDYAYQIPEGQGPGPGQSVIAPGPGQPADDSWGTWPAFRGPEYDLVSREGIELAENWGESGPPVLWTRTVGEGYGSPAAYGGKLYLLDYDAEKEGDVLRCMSLADGRDIWTHFYPAQTPGNHGVTRSVPAVTDKYVVSISPKCFVLCVRADTGEYLWHKSLLSEYGSELPEWYSAQCPIIDDGKVILAPAGEKMMVAVDCETGETVWETPNPRRWKMTHASITPMRFAGKKMYVYPASGGVVGVSAETGEILWEHPGWIVPTANIICPVIVGEDKIFLTGGYGAGSRMIQLVEDDDGSIRAREVYSLSPRQFSTYQQTPIFYKGFIYGVLTKTAGTNREQLACMKPDGTIVWTSGPKHRFGWGPWVIANEKIFTMDDHGLLTMAAANPGGFQILDQVNPFGPDGAHEAWGPLTIIGGRMICRDLTTMVCIDLRNSSQ